LVCKNSETFITSDLTVIVKSSLSCISQQVLPLTGSKHLDSFGVSKNGYDIQKQHNKQVRDWFQRHHNEVVVVQYKQRGRNWRWLTSDEDADVDRNETKHLRDSY